MNQVDVYVGTAGLTAAHVEYRAGKRWRMERLLIGTRDLYIHPV